MPQVLIYFEEHGTAAFTTSIAVDFVDTPLAAAVITELLANEHEALNVRWSGLCIEIAIPKVELPEGTPERGDSNDFPFGTVFVDPGRFEMGLNYGTARWQDVSTPQDCFVIGKATADRTVLEELGNRIRRFGWQRVTAELRS